MQVLKQRLLGSAVGRAALLARDRLQIIHAACFNPEQVGTIANDQLATLLVTRICLSGKRFIDVGAHIGSIIAEVSRTDASIQIEAVEAIPEKAARLENKFPHIQLHACAVGESSGEVSFFIDLKRSGYSSLEKPAADNNRRTAEITVPIKRLDEIVTANDVDAIKIDVEGAELDVLRGSTAILKNCRPVVMFESAPAAHDSHSNNKTAIYEFLESQKYVILAPNRVAHDDPGLSRDGFLSAHLYPRLTTNYFALPLERRHEIQARARRLLRIRA